jgi:hypothetical protein
MYDLTVVHVLLVGHLSRRTPLYSLAAGKRLQFFVLKGAAMLAQKKTADFDWTI